MRKTVLALMLACSILTGLVGCSGQNESVQEGAQTVADAFAANDMEAINEVVFGTAVSEANPELADASNTTSQEELPQEGILTCVFERTTIEVGNATDSTIEYFVSAPDMSGVFDGLDAGTEDMTEEEFLKRVQEYASKAELKEVTVTLGYELVDGKPVINYRDDEFVDAVTGGLLNAYEELYAKMLDEYAKGLE